MAQDLNSLLQAFKELAQTAKESGRLSPEQLQSEVKRLTGELQRTLVNLGTQLQSGGSPESAYLMEVFQAQVRTILEQNGMQPEELPEEEEAEKLSEDLALHKRGHLRT